MAEVISNISSLLPLIQGLIGLIPAAVGAFFAVKNWITVLKTKQSQEIWTLVMEIADKAMTEAEHSGASGADKKAMVIDAVKASATAAGLDVAGFIDQLGDYIDQTIEFFNKMNKA